MEFLVSVCLCTFRRQEGVAKALLALGQLEAPPGGRIEIVVVDNDPAESARSSVEHSTRASRWPVRYFVEPRSGVSFARNRCLAEATGGYVAFIDDDEWCAPDWIVRLYETLLATSSTAVFGPVLPRFDVAPAGWLEKSGAFDRPRFPTGTIVDWRNTRTGNVILVRNPELIGSGFDPAYASTGGEDVAFFQRLALLGARYVWCDEAPVYESVPKSRVAPRWILRRAFAGGKTYVRLRAKHGGNHTYFVMTLRGVAGVFCFSACAAVTFPLSPAKGFSFARRASGDAGKAVAFIPSRRGDYGT